MLKRREGNRAPGLKCKNLRDLRAAALDDFGRLEEQSGAFGGRRLGPRREGFGGSVDGAFGLGAPAGRSARVKGTVVWLIDVEELAVLRGPPFAADKILVFVDAVIFRTRRSLPSHAPFRRPSP